jgi:small GTP-binding protein
MKKIKITIVGNQSVGKTSILFSFLDKNVHKTRTTLGIDFFTKGLSIGQDRLNITLWDTAGAERFRALSSQYLRDSDIIIIAYDLSKRISNIPYWMRQVEQHKPKVVGILGNKTDLTKMNTEDLHDMLYPWTRQNWKVFTGTCSSRDSNSVKKFFRKCLKEVTLRNLDNPFELPNITLQPEKTHNRTCCT